ncbi:nitrate/nitrite transporter [Salinibacterium sp. GXW1014]|uniref:MFS transporter n=1 Tax=Salinibacterium sp. GXW1014 TaxID=3377838 RepID=UPI00383A44E2
MNSRRSWVIWGCAVFAYVVAVMQRSSLGVAAVEATERYEITASVLSTLAVVQLIVYAGLQVPVGVMLDRVGPRVLISGGAAFMLAGQLAVAFADHFWLAVVGRILVGTGDAMTFISVLRLLPLWFAGRILPQVSQWTGNVGQLGQLLSAVPFAWVLHDFGWTPAFGLAGAAALCSLLLTLAVVRDSPAGTAASGEVESWGHAFREAREALRRPGTQLGFWSHFTTQAPGSMFALLWGFPFLVSGLGYSPGTAAGLLSLLLLSGVIAGPILGILTARYPFRRSSLVLGIVACTVVAWLVVLAQTSPPPFWLVCMLIIVLGAGGPGSLIGFEFARSFNPLRSHGSATGIVNVGGFVASLTMMFLIGMTLDAVSGDAGEGLYSWQSFRVAFATQFLVLAVGTGFILHTRRLTRRRLKDDEGIEVGPLWVALYRALRRKRG